MSVRGGKLSPAMQEALLDLRDGKSNYAPKNDRTLSALRARRLTAHLPPSSTKPGKWVLTQRGAQVARELERGA